MLPIASAVAEKGTGSSYSTQVGFTHKVRILYICKEYHSVCPLVGIGTLTTPLSPASVPRPPTPPEPGGGGGTLACG
jgi:hypothetical protein